VTNQGLSCGSRVLPTKRSAKHQIGRYAAAAQPSMVASMSPIEAYEELRQVIVDQAQALEALGIDLSPAPKANAKKH
jgi:hypothetical protein